MQYMNAQCVRQVHHFKVWKYCIMDVSYEWEGLRLTYWWNLRSWMYYQLLLFGLWEGIRMGVGMQGWLTCLWIQCPACYACCVVNHHADDVSRRERECASKASLSREWEGTSRARGFPQISSHSHCVRTHKNSPHTMHVTPKSLWISISTIEYHKQPPYEIPRGHERLS